MSEFKNQWETTKAIIDLSSRRYNDSLNVLMRGEISTYKSIGQQLQHFIYPDLSRLSLLDIIKANTYLQIQGGGENLTTKPLYDKSHFQTSSPTHFATCPV